ncbi:hypothetical protein OPT61_g3348 [Boeremia exigua]|uniref:Uncharacterized protein n=1 Tax=Boeremia exigua TaxID=749465 RepID=A0ACC2II78_9PLEO|nr:hypothetical protein OPT61_g3348 [Boeremia exigua]
MTSSEGNFPPSPPGPQTISPVVYYTIIYLVARTSHGPGHGSESAGIKEKSVWVKNTLSVEAKQQSKQQKARPACKPPRFRIKDVTADVVRNYQHSGTTDPPTGLGDQQDAPSSSYSPSTLEEDDSRFRHGTLWEMNVGSTEITASPAHTQRYGLENPVSGVEMVNLSHALSNPVDIKFMWQSPGKNDFVDDSIFLPGSAYLNAHSTFRSHLIHEVRSTAPSRQATPEHYREEEAWSTSSSKLSDVVNEVMPSSVSLDDPQLVGSNFVNSDAFSLLDEEESLLWKNWLDEIAPWLDKFDSEQHFQLTLPILARSHDHLRYSILAVSARQLERKQRSRHTERSLALYQKAIQLVLPQLYTRSTAVIASCVVLCVLEMLSSSPKAWRQHLDGCAYLIEAIGINGFSGGVDQALFWCFARMDVCGGLIASMKPLICVEHWTSADNMEADIELFRARDGFNAFACHAVYMCARVLDFLAFHTNITERVGPSLSMTEEACREYAVRWTQIWHYMDDWHDRRPAEMLPVFSIAPSTKPFPEILYSNPAAISGNQIYHTAAILMLRHKPPGVVVAPKPHSIFWHARQICGISISNHHHGAWTNAVQPLWIAGQWMSHKSEQRAILVLLEKIEIETGWGTKWRADDLREFWGYE